MKSKIFLQLIILFLGFFAFISESKASVVPENEASQWVNDQGYKLIDALSNQDIELKHRVLDEMFETNLDTDYMAKFVVGKYWRMFTSEQRERYVDLFKRYALSIYKSYPLDFNLEGLNFSVLNTQDIGGYTDVSCFIKLPDQLTNGKIESITVVFKLTKTNGQIKIVDLKIAESSLLLTYRNRFTKMIKDSDEELDWFLDDLSDLTVSNEKNVELQLEN